MEEGIEKLNSYKLIIYFPVIYYLFWKRLFNFEHYKVFPYLLFYEGML